MKKILVTLLAATMVLSLVACSNDEVQDTPVDDETQGNVSVEENVNNAEEDTNEGVEDSDVSDAEQGTDEVQDDPADDEAQGNDEVLEKDPVAVASLNERLAYIINSVRPQEEIDAFGVETTNDNMVLMLLGLEESQLEEYAITFSAMNVHAYMIGILKPVDSDKQAALDALTTYQNSMIQSFERYLPEQLEIAENAIIFDEAGYVGLVMCANSTDIKDALVEKLSNIDDILVDERLVLVEAEIVEDTTTEEYDAEPTLDEVVGE